MKLEKEIVAQSFSKAAVNYEASAFLQKEVASRLFERLEIMNVSPLKVLDAGCGTGYCTRMLNKKFSKAQLFGVDFASGMIEQAKKQKGFFDKIDYRVADIEKLPFDSNYFDLVFSNLTVQWLNESDTLFKELNRVLKPGGLLIFSTLGPDTLMELRQSWQKVDENVHVNDFLDMHIIGDRVYDATFDNTVMDRDVITLTYQTLKGLMQDLKAIGAHNMNQDRSKGLSGKNKFVLLSKAYDDFRWDDGQLPATYEVVYGHAWKKIQQPKGDYHTYQVEITKGSK
jgi:malonyl-CoA O-methyltransferase